MAVTRSHPSKQRAGIPVTPKKVFPHALLNISRDRPGAAISKQLRVSRRIRRPSAQLREELENAIRRTASAKEHEKALQFLFVPFPDVKDIAEETHVAIDASNTSDRFLARYPMYNAQNMAMIQQELGKGFASHGMTSTKPYYEIPILHQGIVTMQHLAHTFNRDVTIRSWNWLQAQLDMVTSRPIRPSPAKVHNPPIRKTASHPRKTQQHALFTDPNTPCIIYLHWTIDPGPSATDLAAIHATIASIQSSRPHKLFRAFPSLSETTCEILKTPDIHALDAIAATSPPKYAYRPLTCFTHADPGHSMTTCPLRGHKQIIMKRTHSCSGEHVELVHGNEALPRHAPLRTKTKQQQQQKPSPPYIYFAQSYEPSFSQHGEYRVFITARPSASPTALRGREGRILHTVITEWVDRHDPGAMYARVATAQDFHSHSHSHSHSRTQRKEIAPLTLPSLHEFALYTYSRLRAREDWKECYESLEMGVRLDVGVGTTMRRRRKEEGKGGGEKRFFVNEITRFYGADYFSQHTLGAPQQEVCWAFAEAVDGYFGAGGGEGEGEK